MTFIELINNIKRLKGIEEGKRTDKPIRELLGITSAGKFSQYKKQNTIPFKEIIEWGLREKVPLNLVFGGEDPYGLDNDKRQLFQLWDNAITECQQGALEVLRAGQKQLKKTGTHDDTNI